MTKCKKILSGAITEMLRIHCCWVFDLWNCGHLSMYYCIDILCYYWQHFYLERNQPENSSTNTHATWQTPRRNHKDHATTKTRNTATTYTTPFATTNTNCKHNHDAPKHHATTNMVQPQTPIATTNTTCNHAQTSLRLSLLGLVLHFHWLFTLTLTLLC